jgi:transglutaminase-like putative cysteine protease
MEINVVPIDDQPISATFFGEGKWLSDFITPDQPDIKVLWGRLTDRLSSVEDKVIAAWDWVANEVKYKPFIKANISVEGKISYQNDYWQSPSLCSRTKVGNCANKAFLLTSLLRNTLGTNDVHAVLGNLYNGHAAGHAWVEATINGKTYIVEPTRNDVPLIEPSSVDRYEPVHYFNDSVIYAVPGRTVMTPFQSCFSKWLGDYLQWSYINGSH